MRKPVQPSVSRHAIAGSSVLVVGDVMLDQYWFGDVERISPEAPVPIVRVRREEYRLGGAANVARNIAALGARVTLLGVTGADAAGDRLTSLLDEVGIASELARDPDFNTTLKLRVSGHHQQLLRVDFEERPGSSALAVQSDAYRRLAGSHDVVILSDYGKGALSQVSAMIEHARSLGRPVLVDPKGDDYAIYRGAALVTPNRGELAKVTGSWRDDQDLAAKARDLRERLDLNALLVTRSEEGMSLFDDQGEFRIGAEAREVFDVTGAGDTVIAVVAVLMAAGLPVRQAVPLANRAGGIVVGRFGTAAVSYDDLFPSEHEPD